MLGFAKRCLDLAVAIVALIVTSPVLLCAALAIRWKDGSPVFFRQLRPGYKGRPFTFLKFRTMSNVTDESGTLLPDADRLTSIGLLLRKLSIDELPQLWNVLRGDMSLVGPRPLLVHYLEHYTPEQARRHDVMPGITGWTQINGRNGLSWKEKFAYDVWYVDHRSFWLDLKILWLTIAAVLRREGINQPGVATADQFTGIETNPAPSVTCAPDPRGRVTRRP